MSTILKALRRLEDDDPKKKRTGAPPVLRDGLTPAPLPATDPRAADALRGRILAEEAAARVGAEPRDDESPNPRRLRPFILRTLVASLLVAAVAFAVTESGLFSTAPTVDSAPEPAPSNRFAVAEPTAVAGAANLSAPRAMVAVPSPLAVPEQAPSAPVGSVVPVAPIPPPVAPVGVVAAVAPPPTTPNVAPPPSAPAPTATPTTIARVTPSPAQPVPTVPVARPSPSPSPQVLPTAAVAAKPSPTFQPNTAAQPPAVSPPPPTQATAARAPAPRSAPPAEAPAAVPVPAPAPVEIAAVRPSPAAEPPRAAPRPAPVRADEFKRVAPAGFAEVTVVRTAWHPKPERRSAKVRIAETNELVTAREGDTVAGLVLREITPSAVVFSAGDVEIRRRVGEKTTTR